MLKICVLNIADLPNQLYVNQSVFSPARVNKIATLQQKDDALRSMAAEICLAHLCLQEGVAKTLPVKYEYTAYGKPMLTDSHLHVSIAHCGRFAAASLSDLPHGIDLEQLARSQQIKRVLHLPAQTDAHTAAQEWSARESFLKMLGMGVRTHQAFEWTRDGISFQGKTACLQYHQLQDVMLCAATPSTQDLQIRQLTRQDVQAVLNFKN